MKGGEDKMYTDKLFYYSPKTLNVFCDASIVKMPDGECISCPWRYSSNYG